MKKNLVIITQNRPCNRASTINQHQESGVTKHIFKNSTGTYEKTGTQQDPYTMTITDND